MPLIMPKPSFFPTALLRRRLVRLLLMSLSAAAALLALVSVFLVLSREQHAVAGSDAGRSAAALLSRGNSVGGEATAGSSGSSDGEGNGGPAASESHRKQLAAGFSRAIKISPGAAAMSGEGNTNASCRGNASNGAGEGTASSNAYGAGGAVSIGGLPVGGLLEGQTLNPEIAGGLPAGRGLPEIWAQGPQQLNGSSGRGGGALRSACQEQLLRLIGEAKVTELKALCGR